MGITKNILHNDYTPDDEKLPGRSVSVKTNESGDPPVNVALTPSSKITLDEKSIARIFGRFIYISVKFQANENIENETVVTLDMDKNFYYPTTIPIGTGTQWSITGTGSGYLTGKTIVARISSGQWGHIVATIPWA